VRHKFPILLSLFSAAASPAAESVYEFTLKSIDGKPVSLESYKGKVLLLVNVASRCGFTPQYKGLESLYRRYKDRGLVVLGFPANNFMRQEPGTNEEILTFCKSRYDVTFPMFAKISVRGSDKAPLFRYLTDSSVNSKTGGEIAWNFTKFLVGRDGRIAARFGPATGPESKDVVAAIEQALAR
jgi:glutathione peroxidase